MEDTCGESAFKNLVNHKSSLLKQKKMLDRNKNIKNWL